MIIRPEAEQEIAEVVTWYCERREKLGEEFLLELDKALEAIDQMPEMWPVVYKHVRRIQTRRFPFVVFYEIQGSEVVILAVVHNRRNPDFWTRRI